MDYSHAGGRQCRVPGAGERGFFGGEGRVEMGTAEESEGLGVEFEGVDGACGARGDTVDEGLGFEGEGEAEGEGDEGGDERGE